MKFILDFIINDITTENKSLALILVTDIISNAPNKLGKIKREWQLKLLICKEVKNLKTICKIGKLMC